MGQQSAYSYTQKTYVHNIVNYTTTQTTFFCLVEFHHTHFHYTQCLSGRRVIGHSTLRVDMRLALHDVKTVLFFTFLIRVKYTVHTNKLHILDISTVHYQKIGTTTTVYNAYFARFLQIFALFWSSFSRSLLFKMQASLTQTHT